MAQPVSARCPECDSTIRFPEAPNLGALVTCPECEAELEVVRRAPLKLDWAYDEEFEDEEYEEYEEYDDFDDEEYDDEDWDDEDED